MTAWLLDTLFYTGLLIGLVLLVRRPAARLLGPQFAYTLWTLPLLRLLLPPIVLPSSLAPESEPVQAVATPLVTSFEVAAAAPQPGTVAIAAPAVVTSPAATAPAWSWSEIAGAALSVWLGVALAFLAWRVVTYRKMRRELLAKARPVGEAGRIRLIETPAVTSPVAFGVLDKVVALPPLFMAQPDRLARDLAIEHELAHHRGYDLLANFAAQALLALHWFNPLAWLGWRAMRRDQEAACDARVLAGRSREERARYAALIARAAAGPRTLTFNGALAAPMAGPVFGEKSIIYRLRSLSMSDVTRRRRWLGHGVMATAALALPLTASISYSATAQVPDPVSPAELPEPPAAPEAPLPPTAPEAGGMHHEGKVDGDHAAFAHHFGQHGDGDLPPIPPVPPVPPVPAFQFHGMGNPEDPEFQARMEEFGRQMEEWGEKFGEEYAKYWEQWGEQHRDQALALAEHHRDQALAQAERHREQALAQAARQRDLARSSLRQARDSIAHNRDINEDVRAEILRDLDEEIGRIERGED